jgi:uncharacterized protein
MSSPVPSGLSPGGGGLATAPEAPPDSDSRTWAMIAHFSGPASAFLSGGMLAFVGPLVIWLVYKDKSRFAAEQAKEALNFHITVTVLCYALSFAGFMLSVVTLGIAIPLVLVFGLPMLFGIVVAAFILGVVAGLEAQKGVPYRYPFAWRVIR